MAPDDDVEMVDAGLPRFSTVEKGKSKATEPVLPEEDNGLPWCVCLFAYLMGYSCGSCLQGGKVSSGDHG